MPPRIAQPGTFEYDYGQRFKELQKKYEEKQVALKNEFDYEEKKLEAEMFKAQYDYETARLKDMLRLREMERERLSEQWTHPSVQYGNDNRINSEVLYTQARKLDYMLESQEQELQVFIINRLFYKCIIGLTVDETEYVACTYTCTTTWKF